MLYPKWGVRMKLQVPEISRKVHIYVKTNFLHTVQQTAKTI